MAAAAANRRSKRTLLQRLTHHVTQWWEARTHRLDIGGYFQPRPLIIALLYSVLMILALNLVLKSDPTASFEYMRGLASAQSFKQLLTPDLWTSVLTGGGLARSQAGHSNIPQTPAEVDDAPKSAFDFSAARFSLFAANDGDTESSASFLASPAGSFGRAFSSPAVPVSALLPPTHWVKEGDGITFGDYGLYGASEPKSASGQNAAPTAARSASTVTGAPSSQQSSRTTASTASAVPKTRSAPSENVQRTQYVPKSEYVLSANAALKSPYTYQWTKDGVNITNGFYVNQPYFSIKRTRREDAGLYRCYRYEVAVAKAPAVLVLETALQISSKLSTAPVPVLRSTWKCVCHCQHIHTRSPGTATHIFGFLLPSPFVTCAGPPTVNLKPSHHVIKAGSTMVLNLAAEGTPPPIFQWYKNGYPVPGLTAPVLVMDQVNTTHSGTYSCEVQNIAGRLMWLEATIAVTD
jgi:hypothetical protein